MAKRMVGYRVTGGELAPKAYAIYEDVPESMSESAEVCGQTAAFQNTDDADPALVLAAVRHCASSWEGEARLLGNVRAKDIVRAIDASHPAKTAHRCPHCDDTGDVHRADGEWLGRCDCKETTSTQIDSLTAINHKLTTDLTALALDWQERAEKLSIALAAEQAINKDLKIELDEARADIEASISDFKVAGGKLSEAQDELTKLRALLKTVHGKFCTIAAGEAWTDTCLDGYRKTPGGLREFAESAAKEIDRSIEAGTARD